MPTVCAVFPKLTFAFALVSGFGLDRPIEQGLSLACLHLFLALFIPEMHIGSAQPEADGAADDQQEDARGFHTSSRSRSLFPFFVNRPKTVLEGRSRNQIRARSA